MQNNCSCPQITSLNDACDACKQAWFQWIREAAAQWDREHSPSAADVAAKEVR